MKQTLTAPKKAQHGSTTTAQRSSKQTGNGPQAALMQMQSRYGNRAVTQWMKSQKTIQRTVKGADGGNIWSHVGESGLGEQSERVQKIVHLLHSVDQLFLVRDFQELFEQIQAGTYDTQVQRILRAHFNGASLEEVPLQTCKFENEPSAPMNVNIGISFRTDGRGTSHTGYDQKSVAGINEVSHRVQASPRTLPEGAAGEKFDRNLDALNYDSLKDVDGLLIPGAPYPNNTQVASEHSTNKEADKNFSRPKPKEKDRNFEMNNRSDYELKLLEKARTLGMPMMALCGGSWRLLEAHGGQVETLPETEREKHKAKNSADTWKLKHDLNVEGGSMLSDTLPQRDSLNLPDANSTHWAVASVSRDEETKKPTGLVQSGKELEADPNVRAPRDPNDTLEINAMAPGAHGPTVEGFESKHGAPAMGLQWHPESYLPGMVGNADGSFAHRQQSATLFRHFAEAAGTYRNRRTMVAEFKREQAIVDKVHECEQLIKKSDPGAAELFAEIQRLLQELGATKGRAFEAVQGLIKKMNN